MKLLRIKGGLGNDISIVTAHILFRGEPLVIEFYSDRTFSVFERDGNTKLIGEWHRVSK